MGHLLRVNQLVAHCAVIGATTHGEVIAHKHHRAPADIRPAHHQVGRHQVHEPAVTVVAAAAAQSANLPERTGIGDTGNPLPYRKLAGRLVARHLFLTAHAGGESPPVGKFINLWLPGHGVFPLWRRMH